MLGADPLKAAGQTSSEQITDSSSDSAAETNEINETNENETNENETNLTLPNTNIKNSSIIFLYLLKNKKNCRRSIN